MGLEIHMSVIRPPYSLCTHDSYLWISNDLLMSEQKGAFRVNCIDCLDRTNVVEVRDLDSVWLTCFPCEVLTRCRSQRLPGTSSIVNWDRSHFNTHPEPLRRRRMSYSTMVRLPNMKPSLANVLVVWANNGDAISRE